MLCVCFDSIGCVCVSVVVLFGVYLFGSPVCSDLV